MFLGLLKTTNRGRECLVFKYPTSPDRCNVFLKIKDADGCVVASCICCRGIHRSYKKKEHTEHWKLTTIPVVNGTCFGSDPALATHLPGCGPTSFHDVMERFNSAVSKSPISDESDSSMSEVDEDCELPSENEDDDDVAQSRSQSSDDSDSSMSEEDDDDIEPFMGKDDDGQVAPEPDTIDVSEAPSPTSEKPASAISGFVEDDDCEQPAVKKDKETRPGTKRVRFNLIAQFAKSPTPTSDQSDSCFSGTDDDCEQSAAKDHDIKFEANIIGSPTPASNQTPSSLSGKGEGEGCKQPAEDNGEDEHSETKTTDAQMSPTPTRNLPSRSELVDCERTPVEKGGKICFDPTSIGDSTHDYPVEMCMLATNPGNPVLLFKFRDVNNELKCYKFRVKKDRCLNKDFMASCSGCGAVSDRSRARNPSQRSTVQMKTTRSDGYRMLSDPHANHVAGCVPFEYGDTIMSYPLVTDEVREKVIKANVTPLEQYPVSIAMNANKPTNPLFIYRLIGEPDKCYKFICKRHNTSHGTFSVVCSGCDLMYYKEKERNGEYPSKPVKLTDGRAMFSDPNSGHLPGCIPLDYNECLKKTALVSDLVAKKIIERKVSSTVTRSYDAAPPQQNYSKRGRKLMKRKIYGLEQESEGVTRKGYRDKKPIATLSPSAKKRRSSASSVPYSFKRGDNVSLDESQHLDSDGNSQPSADMLRDSSASSLSKNIRNFTWKRRSSSELVDAFRKNCRRGVAASDVAVALPSLPIKDESTVQSVRKIQIAHPTTFIKKFDAMAFNEDEADVSVLDGRLLRVSFERMVFPISESRSFLTHELTLPENVDIDSLMCSWNEGSLVVRADFK